MTDDLIMRARLLAYFAHYGQVDKAGKPYIDHPRAVALNLAAAEPEHPPTVIAAAWLHDVVEDSEITLDDLRRYGFPPEVVRAVDSVTRRDGELYTDLIKRAAADPIGRLVKLADNAHNSSPERLAALEEPVRSGLARRYAKARKILEAAG